MKTKRRNREIGLHFSCRSRAAVWVAMLGFVSVAVMPLRAQDNEDMGKAKSETGQKGFGIIASKEAGAKDVGLPLYPGARQHKDTSEETPAVNFALWGGNSGFKLAVLKLESNDAPEKVAAFYRKALTNYGKVLDCSASSQVTSEKKKGASSNELGCEDEHPESGELVLKAGSKQEEHVVGIKVSGGITLFQLVYVMTRGSDSEN